MKAFGAALAAATFFGNVALAAVDPIVIKGSKFFYETNGTQFFMKGVAYQQEYAPNGQSTSNSTGSSDYTDPISDDSSCERDIPYLQQLGTNTIRVYALDPTKSHDKCMNALADAGIYVIADLSAPGDSIIRSSPVWNDDLYSRYAQVIDAMANYTNTLGFFAGNEVTNNDTNTEASAFVKAAVRDMKAYIKQKNYRSIGVGYATSDDAGIRQLVAQYFDCGESSSAIDFWGYNIYSWCGDSSFSESGYDKRTAEFKDYNVPVFFAEYGCNEVQPRKFTEVEALYGDQMSDVWSGGIVYMYFQEANNYGLVSVSGNSVSTLDDFNYLSDQIASATPSGVNSADYNPTNTQPADCPAIGTSWAASETLPPTPNRELCQCMYSALTCVPHNVADKDAGELFGIVCGLGANDEVCAGITNNATSGVYGAYGMCDPQEQLGWALNAYYLVQSGSGNAASACDFSGSATTQSAARATGQCSALLGEAGPRGTGTVTSAPTGTGNVGGSSSGSGSGNAAARTGSSAVFGTSIAIGAYTGLAFVSGMCMIFL